MNQVSAEVHLPNRFDLLKARHAHLRAAMKARDIPALLEIDSNHILYATGASNMTLFTQRTPARYLLIIADGPTILYEYVGCEHLAVGLPTIDDIRPSQGLDTISSGGDLAGAATRFAAEIAGTLRDFDSAIDTVAIGRFPWIAVDALRAQGLTVTHADDALLTARAIKLDIELPYIREAMRRVEDGVRRLEDRAAPDRSETETWAEFHYSLMAKEGQYISTRLFQSGPNTYPYFKEAGGRILQAGDLLCLDTDAIGFENYAVDFSRTFLCGQDRASDDQRLLYGRAREQLETNADLLAPGRSFEEIARKAWKVPDEHMASRYYCVGHGLGMAGEFPNIPHHVDGKAYPLPGHLEPGMIICVESYVGWDRSAQGVKLENQYLITETGTECMSNYPFDERLSGRMH